MAKKFQNLSVDYTKLIDKMSIGERVSMIRSDEGRQLLSMLTPYQLSEMFPDYYKKNYPDVGAALKSISNPSFKPLSREEADKQMAEGAARLTSRERTAIPETKPAWLRRIEEQTGKTISDPGAKAQLSGAKKELLKEMESAGVKSDDPRAKFLGNLSEDDLKKAGISKQTDAQGNIVYRRAEISQAEIQAESQKMASAGVVKIVSAGHGQPTVVEYADGRIEKRTGDRGWRNNNPGNIEYGDFAKKMGAIGSDGRFAIFPTPEAGRSAKENLLFESRGYRGLSIEGAISKYAPPNENNTNNYINQVTQALGLPKNTNISSLSADQRRVLLDAIQKIEGRSTGKTEVLREGLGLANTQPPTQEQLAQIKERIRQREELSLAERTEIPQLPGGVDPNIASFYGRLSPRQKQDFHSMLVTAGGGTSEAQITAGVNRLNELYKQNPTAVQQGIFQGNGRLLFSDQSVADRAGRLNPYMQGALNKFQEFAPQGTTITSTFRGEDHPIEAEKIRRGRAPGAHSRGAAVDIRTEGKSREELAATVQALKRAGFTKILLEGDHIHAEVNPGQSFHVTNLGRGNPNIDIDTANQAASVVAFNEELPGNQRERQQPPSVATATTEPVATPTRSAEITTSQVQPQQTESPAQEIRVNAEGGTEKINSDEIRAMPIDSLRGDNSVVVDKNNNPLFTMNTKEEQAVYNPKTRQVDVQPVTKTNPNNLGEKQTTETMAETDNVTLKENQPAPMQQVVMPSSEPRSGDTSISITDELFKDPSFKRAVAKTRFVDTGDAALGGHFGMAQGDLA